MTTLNHYAPYESAAKRLAELQDKALTLKAERQDLTARLDAAEAPDADALLLADDLDAALSADEVPSLKQGIDRISRQLVAINGAISRAIKEVERTQGEAKRELGKKLDGEYKAILNRQALALIELGKAADEYQAFESQLPGYLSEYGLTQMPLLPVIGDYRGLSSFTVTLVDAVKAGAIGPKDIPKDWEANRKAVLSAR